MPHTNLQQTLIFVVADPKQLCTTAVGPPGLIQELDYQFGWAGMKKENGMALFYFL